METGRVFTACGALLAGVILAALHAITEAQQAKPQEPAAESLSPEQLKSEIKRLQEAVEALRTSPDAPTAWKQLLKAEAKLNEAMKAAQQEQWSLRENLSEFSSSADVKTWRDPIDKMYKRLRELTAEDYKLARIAGSRLFEARHAELAKLAPADSPKLRQLGFDLLTYPRMDGSTSTQPLAALIACRCFGASCGWVGREQIFSPWRQYGSELFFWNDMGTRGWDPEPSLVEFTIQARVEPPENRRLGLIINRLLAFNASTHDAYVNLIEGKSDIGLLARPPSAEELALARMAKIELEALPVAWDAFVFLVNEENSVRNLTTTQIRDIYAGKVTKWKNVGGPDAAITAYQREEESGSQQLMQQLVMKDVPLARRCGENPLGLQQRAPQLISSGMGGPYLVLTRDKDGLAYSVFYYEHFMSGSPRTRTIAVDGVEPKAETIRTRKYPYTTEVLAVTRKGIDRNSPAARLRDWLLSPEGQLVVRESGYVPLAGEDR